MKIIELNFVENVLLYRFKDHFVRSFHFSMINKVVRGYKYDQFFLEFNNDKPMTLYASYPL